MKSRFSRSLRLFPHLFAAILCAAPAMAQEPGEEWNYSVQLELNVDRENLLTHAWINVPVIWVGGMTLEEFSKRFDQPEDQLLVKVLNAIKAGDAGFVSMVLQSGSFQIEDASRAVEFFRESFFPGSESPKIDTVIPLQDGRAYVMEFVRGSISEKRVIEVRKDDAGEWKLVAVSEAPVLALLGGALRSSVGGQEVNRPEEGKTGRVLSENPWGQISFPIITEEEHGAFFVSLEKVADILEKSDFKEGLSEACVRRYAAWLKNASKKDREAFLAQIVGPLREIKEVFVFDPVYVVFGKDKTLDPVIVVNHPENGLQVAALNVQNDFTHLIQQLRKYPRPAGAGTPKPQVEEPETGPDAHLESCSG